MMNLTPSITIFNEDRMKVMKRYKNLSFDVSIIDPEYGLGESKKNHISRNTPVIQNNGKALKIRDNDYGSSDWDDRVPDDTFFTEIKRVSVDQIIFGANYFHQLIGTPCKPPRRNEYDQFLKQHPTGWIIWDKVNGSNDFSDCEVIYTSFEFPSFVFYYMWNGMMQGLYCGKDPDKAMIQIGDKKLNEKRIHPTQKPVPVYKFLLTELIRSKSTILDTGFGSGSIIIACHDYDIPIVGCENNNKIFNKSLKRIRSHISQTKLIFPS